MMWLGNVAFMALLVIFGLASIGSAIVEGLLEIDNNNDKGDSK